MPDETPLPPYQVSPQETRDALGLNEISRLYSVSAKPPDGRTQLEDESLIGATARQVLSWVQIGQWAQHKLNAPEPTKGYNIFRDDPDLILDDSEDEHFFDSGSRLESIQIRNRLDEQYRDRAVMAENPVLSLMIGLGLTLTDPVNLFPVARGATAPRLIKSGSQILRFAERAGVNSFNAVIGAGAAETIAEATLETHTKEDTVTSLALSIPFGIIVGEVLGRVIGPDGPDADLIGKIAAREIDDGYLQDTLGVDPQKLVGLTEEQYRVALLDAIEAKDPDMAKLVRQGGWVGKAINALVRTPAMRLSRSTNSVARVAAQRLLETPLLRNTSGLFGPSVEVNVHMWEAISAGARRGMLRAWKDLGVTARKDGVRKMGYDAFKQEVAYALTNNGVSRLGKGQTKTRVQDAAKIMRDVFYDPLLREAQKVGLLGEVDLKSAPSYLSRVYDIAAIDADLPGFEMLLRQHFTGRGMSEEAVASAVIDVVDNIRGTNRRQMPYDLVSEGSTFKERQLDIADNFSASEPGIGTRTLEQFTVRDMDVLVSRFVGQWAGDLELARALRPTPTLRIASLLGRAQRGIAKARAGEGVAEVSRLFEEVRDLNVVRALSARRETPEIPALAKELDALIGKRNRVEEKFQELTDRFDSGDGSVKADLDSTLEELKKIDTRREEIHSKARKIERDPEGKRFPKETDFDPAKASETDFVRLTDRVDDIRRSEAREAVEMRTLLFEVNKEFDQQLRAGKRSKKAIEKERESAKQDLLAIRDRLRGTYGQPDDPSSFFYKASTVIKNINFLSKMGGVTISSIPDFGMPIFTNGLIPWMRGLMRVLRRPKLLVGIHKADLNDLVVAAELTGLQRRSFKNSDFFNEAGTLRGIEGMSQRAAEFSAKYAFFIDPWNAIHKSMSSIIISSRVIRDCERYADGTISGSSRRNLSLGGLNKEMALRIAKQSRKYGEGVRGSRIGRSDLWDDKEAARIFRAAILQDVRRTIITPGVGELPRFMGKPILGLLGQFQAFAFSAAQKILVSGVQRRDGAVFSGILAMQVLGGLRYFIGQKQNGREVSDDPKVWATEAVDFSGTLGIFSNWNNIADKITDGQFSMQALIGSDPSARYFSRNKLDAVGGPGFGTMSTLADLISPALKAGTTLSTEHLREGQVKAFRRLWPWQNQIAPFRQLYDLGEQLFNENLGIGKSNR